MELDDSQLCELISELSKKMDGRSLAIMITAFAARYNNPSGEQVSQKKIKKNALKLIRSCEIWSKLKDPDFVEGLSAEKATPKSSRLVKIVFNKAERPSQVIDDLEGLVAAGALDLSDGDFMPELHVGLKTWSVVEPVAALLLAFVTEVDTFDAAGDFLARFFHDPGCQMSSKFIEQVLAKVLANDDVRDLGGEEDDLVKHLPEYEDTIIAALGSADTDSEADENGNLMDFVVDDEESGDDSSSSSVSSRSSGSSVVHSGMKRLKRAESKKPVKQAKQAAKRPKLEHKPLDSAVAKRYLDLSASSEVSSKMRNRR